MTHLQQSPLLLEEVTELPQGRQDERVREEDGGTRTSVRTPQAPRMNHLPPLEWVETTRKGLSLFFFFLMSWGGDNQT